VKAACFILGVLIMSSLGGCASQSLKREQLPALLGKTVTLEGIAEARKLGAALRGENFDVWIDRLQDWPGNYVGRRVRVSGVLEERYDLPVYIQKPGEPVSAGMPVSEGTDLRKASHRYIVRDAKWSLIK
jgi:hypothetical protein